MPPDQITSSLNHFFMLKHKATNEEILAGTEAVKAVGEGLNAMLQWVGQATRMTLLFFVTAVNNGSFVKCGHCGQCDL